MDPGADVGAQHAAPLLGNPYEPVRGFVNYNGSIRKKRGETLGQARKENPEKTGETSEANSGTADGRRRNTHGRQRHAVVAIGWFRAGAEKFRRARRPGPHA